MEKDNSKYDSLPNWDSRVAEEYVNIWGDKITVYINGNREVIKSNRLEGKIPGTMVHVFMEGYFLINEDGVEVSSDDNFEFRRLVSKYRFKEKLRVKIGEEFKGGSLQEGPNNSVALNDREIIPDCYWGLPKNEEEVKLQYKEIVNKVFDYKFPEEPLIDINEDELP